MLLSYVQGALSGLPRAQHAAIRHGRAGEEPCQHIQFAFHIDNLQELQVQLYSKHIVLQPIALKRCPDAWP
jgi:hypothetical protein